MRANMFDPFLSHHAPLSHLPPPGRVEAARSGGPEPHAAPARGRVPWARGRCGGAATGGRPGTSCGGPRGSGVLGAGVRARPALGPRRTPV